ncbi:hypothetical protein [Salinisphaera aquimarina]|uniref:EF-hand domain-containing protein n=1 Tax=Salinisphaera aquimarina TaxID=2094031 RepID=A0ABV7ES58_9GAMM
MNKLHSSLIACALVGAAFSASAQQEATKDYQKYLDRTMDKSTMDMLDMNADGVITAEEFRQFYNEIFGMMDKNKDGRIMADERPKTIRPDG